MNKIPNYFIKKIQRENPHKWMQVNKCLLVSTNPFVLYRLPNREEVYGGDQKYLLIEPHDGNWSVQYFNPSLKEWVTLISEEKDWVFGCSDLQHHTSKDEFTSIEYETDDGYIKFDIQAWLQANISSVFVLDEDFYYFGDIKFGETKFNIQHCFDEHGAVKGSKQPYLVLRRENDAYNIICELKRYFSKRKLPTEVSDIFYQVVTGQMKFEDFSNWVRGGDSNAPK